MLTIGYVLASALALALAGALGTIRRQRECIELRDVQIDLIRKQKNHWLEVSNRTQKGTSDGMD